MKTIMEMLKVSSKSNPKRVAKAIVSILKEENTIEVQAIGAGAVNQAVKSIIIARSFLTLNGKDIVCVPAFADIKINGEKRTALKLLVKIQQRL